MRATIVALIYLLSASLFIFGLKRLSRVRTARAGNGLAALGMFLAVVGTLIELGFIDWRWIAAGVILGSVVGAVVAVRVPMTSMPEMVALLNGLGGAASALVAIAIYQVDVIEAGRETTAAASMGSASVVTAILTVLVGTVTLSGSGIAWAKLSETMRGKPILLPGRHVLAALLLLGSIAAGVYWGWGTGDPAIAMASLLVMTTLAFVLGVLLVIPIGGADMPVVVSLLNSYSGVAAAMAGFVIGNLLLVTAGAMVGAAGLILTRIMCVAMNRSLVSVVLGGFGGDDSSQAGGGGEYQNVRSASPEEAAMVLEAAQSVVIVPGYGLAVAQAQHAARQLGDLLGQRGVRVTYAIHPVAGRMPGHMNVLLAEADVPYEQLWEMERINPEFPQTDVVLVLGANDVVNPAAQQNSSSPIYGMPILEVHNARTVFVVKRSLGAGYAGIKNELFERENAMMIFGDAKRVLQELIAELDQAAAA